MSLQDKLIEEKSFEITLVIDELEVLFKVEYNVCFFNRNKFHFTLTSVDTDDRLYGYEYTFDPQQSLIWNMDDCIKKTHAHLGALVYSKKRGVFVVPNEIDELAYHTFKKYTKKKEKCCICLEKVDIVFNKCYHAACCKTCSKTLEICPICRTKIESISII